MRRGRTIQFMMMTVQTAEAIRLVQKATRAKHADTCLAPWLQLCSIQFLCLRVSPVPEENLTRVYQRYVSHARIRPWEAHQWFYRRFSFTVMRGVAEQLIRRQPSTLASDCISRHDAMPLPLLLLCKTNNGDFFQYNTTSHRV